MNFLEILDPEITGNPEFVERDRRTLRRCRPDLDAKGRELFTPHGIGVAWARAGAANQVQYRVVVPGYRPRRQFRIGVGRSHRHESEHCVNRRITKPGQGRGRVSTDRAAADAVRTIGKCEQPAGIGASGRFRCVPQAAIRDFVRRNRCGRNRVRAPCAGPRGRIGQKKPLGDSRRVAARPNKHCRDERQKQRRSD